MANLYLISLSILLLFSTANIYGEVYFSYPHSNSFSFIFILAFLFVFLILIYIIIHYIGYFKKKNILSIYLSLENMWNSVSMQEAKRKAASYLTRDILNSEDEKNKNLVYYSKVIMDFFNYVGLQVYYNIIDLEYIYNLFGHEALHYWEDRNFKLLVLTEKTKAHEYQISSWPGFEYLSERCRYFKNYFYNLYYNNISEKTPTVRQNSYLLIFSCLALVSFAVFLFSYLFFHGYV